MLVFVGHNPTASSLVHLLDYGEPDAAAFRTLSAGLPTSGVAVLEVPVPWTDLDARLRAAGRRPHPVSDLTYPEVGATREADAMPSGYHHLRERRRVGGADAFDLAGDVVLTFGMQRGAGIQVLVSEPLARTGLEVGQRVRLGPMRLHAPTQVVYVLSEPDRRGFAYGTLQGHPERGEELFLVERQDGSTYAEVRSFSRPGRWFSRLGRPVVRWVQRRYVERYLDALTEALTPAVRGS